MLHCRAALVDFAVCKKASGMFSTCYEKLNLSCSVCLGVAGCVQIVKFDSCVLAAQVYRMDSDSIGCSLAEAAETPLYSQYLSQASQTGEPALHVVYINTSLKTKAQAHAVVPTITCTSSNVVQTVLQVSTNGLLCLCLRCKHHQKIVRQMFCICCSGLSYITARRAVICACCSMGGKVQCCCSGCDTPRQSFDDVAHWFLPMKRLLSG